MSLCPGLFVFMPGIPPLIEHFQVKHKIVHESKEAKWTSLCDLPSFSYSFSLARV